jgi:hypothetical protein
MGAWEVQPDSEKGGKLMRQVSPVWPNCWGHGARFWIEIGARRSAIGLGLRLLLLLGLFKARWPYEQSIQLHALRVSLILEQFMHCGVGTIHALQGWTNSCLAGVPILLVLPLHTVASLKVLVHRSNDLLRSRELY